MTSDSVDFPANVDTLIIGGGIVGLAVACELQQQQPSHILVVDKEPSVAAHQTGHNSGVIHSGIYYRPQSLKAKLAVAGSALMHNFCDEYGIPVLKCGKVIVATDESEFPQLQKLYDYGQQNGVPNLELIEQQEIKVREPHVAGLKAIWVPGASSVNYKRVSEQMLELFKTAGGSWQHSCRVTTLNATADSVTVETSLGTVQAKNVIVCAGVYSDRLAKHTESKLDLKIVPFRGEYLKLKKHAEHLVNGLIYPVPNPDLPFLGVHLTRTVDAGVEAGPNAVAAFSREGYSRANFSMRDCLETLSYPGFWKLALRYWKVGVFEELRSLSRGLFTQSLQKLVPEIQSGDLEAGPAGVRAQALKANGELLDDFCFVRSGRVFHVVNAPSPAATASIAIAKHVVNEFLAAK